MAACNPHDNPYLAALQAWNEAAALRAVGIIAMVMAMIGFVYGLLQSTQVGYA
jgi:type IV secretion system protein TrbF